MKGPVSYKVCFYKMNWLSCNWQIGNDVPITHYQVLLSQYFVLCSLKQQTTEGHNALAPSFLWVNLVSTLF